VHKGTWRREELVEVMIQKERNDSTNSIYTVYLSLPRLFKKAERQINVAITDGVHVCLSTPGLPEEETPVKKGMKHEIHHEYYAVSSLLENLADKAS